jgi:hypothetical protein
MYSTPRRALLPLRLRAAGVAVAAIASALALVAPASAATTFTQSLSVKQALAFQSTNVSAFGMLTSLKVGTLTLSPDLVSTDPTQSPVAPLTAVGILSSDAWSGSTNSPLTLDFQVSAANHQLLAAYLLQPVQNTNVSVSFRSYSFDQPYQRWYQSFDPTNDTILDGLIARSGGQLQIMMDMQPTVLAGLPNTYAVHLQIVPGLQTGETIMESVGVTTSRVLVW